MLRRYIIILFALIAWSAGAHAGVYWLARNVTGTFVQPGPAVAVQLTTGGPVNTVTAQVVATTSCTANLFGSNDGLNWVAVSASTDLQTPGTGNQPATGFVTNGKSYSATWAFWAANVSAVSGSCSVLISG